MSTATARRRRTAVLGIALGLLVVSTSPVAAGSVLAAPPPRGQDKPLVTFGIGPSGPERPDQRAFLEYGVAPGSEIFDHVAVLNQSNVPLELTVYGGDALNVEGGGLDIKKRAERNSDLGAWVLLGQAAKLGQLDASSRSTTTVVVPPQNAKTGRGSVIVPVRIAVPADASPGDHVGGIAASLLSRGDSSSSQNIELEQRVVARVYLRVAGPLEPALTAKILGTEYLGRPGLGLSGEVRLIYRITNSGNIRLGATSQVRVTGPFGLGGRTAAGQRVDELVPGGSAVLTTTVPAVWPMIIETAQVTVRAVPPPGGELPETAPAIASARFWAVTWQEVVALVLLVLMVLYRRWRRCHRKGQPAQPTAPPMGEDTQQLEHGRAQFFLAAAGLFWVTMRPARGCYVRDAWQGRGDCDPWTAR